jgi:hydrogenase nickel incorporation protein HypB
VSTRIIEVRAKVMKQNDLLAHALRDRFAASDVTVVGLVSSPGSGKTAFLEKLLGGLARDFRVAALVGDLATENDAARLKRATPNVRQITTGTEGEDKPLKYPTIFNSSDVAIITKMDMAEAAEFDVAGARRNIESARPGMQILEVSAKTGSGMQNVFQLLRERLAHSREARSESRPRAMQ